MLVSYLPFSAANGALGAIAATTGAHTSDLQWVTDAFAVALGATVLSAGVLGDLYGRRRIAVLGLGLTVAGTSLDVVAGATSAIRLLWAGQALAGVGGGMVMSATLALIAVRPRTIPLWAAAVVAGLGAGPFIASAVTGYTAWQWTFAPIAVLASATAAFGLARSGESSAPAGRRLDIPGQVTGSAGIAALTFAVISGGSTGWSAPATVAAFAVAAAGLAAFALVEHRSPAPLFRPALFASRGFTAAGLSATAVLFAMGGGAFVLSLFFSGRQVDALGIALRLGCLFAANALASLAAGPLQSRFGSRPVLVGGLVIAALGAMSLFTVAAGTGLGGFAWRLFLLGTGSGLVMATSSTVAVQSVPGPLAGMAGAGNNAMRQLGAALGPAVLGMSAGARAGAVGAVHLTAAVLAILFAVTAAAAALLLRTPTISKASTKATLERTA
ncbi:MFS transporter [Actinoplanes sp. KI2]|uniref:MFS transporter n=1 Tax=Actinoplanes sp. KI2 TaxID=2983315 RepID=UPI0021D573AA|nr:MFS transporter [Actinoplanes sp. KI2]MCU7730733.1 MFS transporter [Actinoplanes sp. KI2]